MVESLRERNNAASRKYRKNHPERNRAATKRWREANREKHRQLSLKWSRESRELDPEKGRAAIRKSKYGVLEAEFQGMKVVQNNRCAICLDVFTKTPCIDHDHVTGKNRELLCRFCNLLLGNSKDRIAVFERAIEYLKKHGVPYEEKAPLHSLPCGAP